MREKVPDLVVNDIQRELERLCAKKTKFILRIHSPESMRTFSWEDIVKDSSSCTHSKKELTQKKMQ